MQQQTVSALIGALEQRFNLHWVAGKCGARRDISKDISWGSHPKVIGHLNLIHPNHIQVVGQIEMAYLDDLPPGERNTTLSRIFSGQTFAIIVAESLPVPEEFQLLADRQGIALLSCQLPSNELVTELRYVLTGMLAEKQTMHGVFMEVISVGVLLTGDSSIGKSELALELITRGHRLIVDDAPEFARITPDIISGSSPPMLHDLLEVRGLGVLNIREMYGDGAIKHSKYLRLIINLVPVEQYNHADRISSDSATREVLGVNISAITLPVAPGRNLAVMVEAAVLNYLLKSRGYDAGNELIRRQEQLMKRGN